MPIKFFREFYIFKFKPIKILEKNKIVTFANIQNIIILNKLPISNGFNLNLRDRLTHR